MPADAGHRFHLQDAGHRNPRPLADGLRGNADRFGELLGRAYGLDGSFKSGFH